LARFFLNLWFLEIKSAWGTLEIVKPMSVGQFVDFKQSMGERVRRRVVGVIGVGAINRPGEQPTTVKTFFNSS